MASVVRLSNGRYALDFRGIDGKPHRLSMGTATYQQAVSFGGFLQAVIDAQRLGQPYGSRVSAWLASLPTGTKRRLAHLGVIAAPAHEYTLTQALAELPPTTAPRTRRLYEYAVRAYVHAVGDISVSRITEADAQRWRAAMQAQGLAESTVRKHTAKLKALINRAGVRPNPFAALPVAALAARRERYISMQEASAIVAATTDLQRWALFGLARYAALRCPSETHAVTWGNVDWSGWTLEVYARKTGKVRRVPIIRPLQSILQDVYDAAPPGTANIVTLSENNMARDLWVSVRAAGVRPWRKPWQALRQSMATDWSQRFGQYAAAVWCGHSPNVAARHYLSVPPGVWEEAIRDSHLGDSNPRPELYESSALPTEAASKRRDSREIDDTEQTRRQRIGQWLEACPVPHDALTRALITQLLLGQSAEE